MTGTALQRCLRRLILAAAAGLFLLLPFSVSATEEEEIIDEELPRVRLYYYRDIVTQPTARTLDTEIRMDWKPDRRSDIRYREVRIMTTRDCLSEKLPPGQSSYSFTMGKHGQLYEIKLVEVDSYGQERLLLDCLRLFLRLSEMPDLPVVEIETENEEEPDYTVAKKPDEKYLGASAADTDYVNGRLRIRYPDSVEDYGEMQIRVRGNTSAVLHPRQPYKIKLEEKADLLQREEGGTKSRHWVLLNNGTSLRTGVGFSFSEEIGMAWTPDFLYVNVFLNGDFRGLYILAENVRREEGRVNIGKDGFLIENDAYFWNEEVYFQTDSQPEVLGYTFKYPDVKPEDSEYIDSVRIYMNRIDRYIEDWDRKLSDYIDAESFARWYLFHHIMGTGDPAGSNIFLYLEHFDPEHPKENLLKLGPVWDMDSILLAADEKSGHRDYQNYYFSYLMKQECFREAYGAEWMRVREDMPRMLFHSLRIFDDQLEAMTKSRELTHRRSFENVISAEEEAAAIRLEMLKRIRYLYRTMPPEADKTPSRG